MENRFQTSFIPKRPMVPGGVEIVRQKGPPSLLLIIGVIIFVITMAIFGGLFFYKKSLTESNLAKKQKIETEINNFEPELTKQLTVLKARIDSGKKLLGSHIAFSSVLSLLESITVKALRYNEFAFNTTLDPVSKEPKMEISIKGEAQSYSAVAFQSDIFSRNENLKNTIFSDVTLNDKGYVVFNIKSQFDPKSILYKKTLAQPEEPLTASSTPGNTPANPGNTGSTTNQSGT